MIFQRYISYPMVEALRDYEPGICGKRDACFVAVGEFGEYKKTSAARSFNLGMKLWKTCVKHTKNRLESQLCK